MTLAGTRPPLISETNLYELHHYARLAIKPGITGLWQVSGRSDITDFEEVVRLDKEYIENWDIAMDIKILLKHTSMDNNSSDSTEKKPENNDETSKVESDNTESDKETKEQETEETESRVNKPDNNELEIIPSN